MTTLVVPEQSPASVWETVWSNVLSAEQWEENYGELAFEVRAVFPWMDPAVRTAGKGKRLAGGLFDDHRPSERWHRRGDPQEGSALR